MSSEPVHIPDILFGIVAPPIFTACFNNCEERTQCMINYSNQLHDLFLDRHHLVPLRKSTDSFSGIAKDIPNQKATNFLSFLTDDFKNVSGTMACFQKSIEKGCSDSRVKVQVPNNNSLATGESNRFIAATHFPPWRIATFSLVIVTRCECKSHKRTYGRARRVV